ncbi:50S ribosomal protein L13 [bacterium]|nr:50S ribosomal protein L13 [bacterium]
MTQEKTNKDASRSWYVIDLNGKVLGRAATKIADILRGKNKPSFAPHIDSGDFVVVLNAAKVVLTGNKMDQKIYYRHTGYMGGLKSLSAEKVLKTDAERVITQAVKGMLPRNTLAHKMIKKLKVYSGSEHPHGAQNPQVLSL